MITRAAYLLFLGLAWTAFAQTPSWLWFKKTEEAETRYFRKTFTLDQAPSAAELTATADDRLDVFVNGARVLSASEWQTGHRAEVKSKLKVGRNVIAIRAHNGDSSQAGMIARLVLTTASGKQTVVTDGTWKSEDRELPGWNGAVFDDAAWAGAEVLGLLGMEPWGNVFSNPAPQAKAAPRREATPAESLHTLDGFRVELLLTGEPEEGSWVNLCKDPKGRLILSPQYREANSAAGLLRITLGPDGRIAKREFIARPLYDAQGMVFAHGALWVVVNKYSTKFESGLYRITDDGSDTWSKIELVKKFPGGGEHGPHAVELGPDGNLYVMAGNHTKPPSGLEPHPQYRNYGEDHVLPRQWDGNGHAAGILAPGGYVLKVDPVGKRFEFFCGGFRNQYDFAFNADGELFTYDSDMEWDWGMPWYVPTRVNHCVSGGDYGWRSGTGRWPEYYADSLGAAPNIGIGCPTGVGNGKGAKFPAKYQRAIYVMDWTYGRLIAVHLTPDGSSYSATWENFVAPAGLVIPGKPKPPLNLTDLVIGDDGAMYFTIGGRGTASGLYRVRYIGGDSTAPAWLPNPEGADARALRRKLESFHGKADPNALDVIWPHLDSPDRFIRFAARVALEAQPVAQWQSRALEEKRVDGGLTSLLALARLGGKSAQDDVLRALGKWPLATLPERQQLDKLRVIQVSLARNGLPSESVTRQAVEKLSASYPHSSSLVNREISQVLIALGAPDAVGKSLALMAVATTQEEVMHYLFHLRTAKHWTMDQRREYFGYYKKDRRGLAHQGDTLRWFEEAGRPYGDGASFDNFLKNFLKEAVTNLTEVEKMELGPLVASLQSAGAPAKKRSAESFPAAKTRAHVRAWTLADFARDIESGGRGRNFERGRQAFVDAQCLACHRMGSEGGGVGPDLTAVSARFKRIDLFESTLEPSKVVSEQFLNTSVALKNGEDVTGRLVDETAGELMLVPNPLQPGQVATVKKAEITARSLSKISPMPEGLLNVLSREEVLDLIAFMEAGGRRDHALFKP